MTMPLTNLSLGVIGDEDLVNGLRLAGVSKYFVIEAEQSRVDEIREATTKLLNDPGIGIIVIQEDHMDYVGDLVTPTRQKRAAIPVVLPVPSKHGTKHPDVAEYYKSFIREFIGFEIEI